MWSAFFWKDAIERAIRTAAQVAVGALTTSATIFEIDAKGVVGTIAISTLVSILTSVGASGVGETGTASVLPKKA